MGKQTIFESIKKLLAGICWHLFLRLNNLTEDEYFQQIVEQELQIDDSRPLENLLWVLRRNRKVGRNDT